MKHLVRDLWRLFYPRLCISCKHGLIEGETIFCLRCAYSLPEFDHYEDTAHPAYVQLQGLTPFRNVVAAYKYSVSSMLKSAFKALKYGDRPYVGNALGHALGKYLLRYDDYRSCEVVIPVPLHKSKLRTRGYNQALMISTAVGEEMGIPVHHDILERVRSGSTQTRKNRWQRQAMAGDNYQLTTTDLPYRSVLIIDDIITTGATITACGEAFRSHPDMNLFAASVAFTKK